MHDQSPLHLVAQAGSIALFGLVVCGAVWAWVRFFLAYAKGVPLWAFEPRRPVPWGLIDLIVVMLIAVGVQSLVLLVLNGLGVEIMPAGDATTNNTTFVLISSAVGSIVTLLAAFAFIRLRSLASKGDLGDLPRPIFRDLSDGITMFLLVILPVFSIQLVLSQFFPPDHPIVTTLLENPSFQLFFIGGFLAVIVAPFVEEYLFRVLLQGWLENVAHAASVGPDRFDFLQLLRGSDTATSPHDDFGSNSDAALPPESEWSSNPYPTPASTEFAPDSTQSESDRNGISVAPARWPIFVSALVFALAHFGHAADPIPLFVFAVGLGWLYQRTHRVWPCIVMHMVLNGLSMLQLMIYVVLHG